MSAKFEFKHDLQNVFATLTDPQFLVDRCVALGELDAECEAEEDGDVIRITMMRKVRRDVPRMLAKVFGDTQVTDYVEEWRPHREGWQGHWQLTVRGHPVTVTGDFQLVPTAKGCRYSVNHAAKAKIPLLGGQIEKFVLAELVESTAAEMDYVKEYLA